MMENLLERLGGPMLNILTNQNLSNVLVIVTRYFGGILLGTGGLVKAYSEATSEALKSAKIVKKELGKEVRIDVEYADFEKLKYYLKQNNIAIINSGYNENVNVMIDVTQEKLENLISQKENLNFNILEIEEIREKFVNIE